MTTEGKVSPLPWVCERTLVVNGLGYEVSLYEHRHEIVRAVNAHDRLVAAAEDALSMCRYLQQSPVEERPYGVDIDRVADKCRAAIAAAKEG